jgi:hypothetical protein
MPGLPAVVAAAVATTILAVFLASSGSAQTPGERTITFTTRNDVADFKRVDNPPKSRSGDRLSLGDMFVFAQPLFDEANEHRTGRVSTRARRSSAEPSTPPAFSARRASGCIDGTIEAQGLSGFGRTPLQIAVVGGTQAYQGARGTFSASAGEETSTGVIHLLP